MYRELTEKMLDFIEKSPSCYHAVDNIAKMLDGFTCLKEEEDWKLQKGGKYYVIRKDSSIIAFKVPTDDFTSVYIAAAHSDSPCFKIKPNPGMEAAGAYAVINTEKYGGSIMSTWMDRPLSVAGRVITKVNGEYVTKPVNIDRDLLLIPNVAVHMNRDINDGYKFNAQVDMLPLFGEASSKDKMNKLVAEAAELSEEDILASDLFLYIREKGTIWGADNEFISSRALDDLQCAYAITKGFIDASQSPDKLSLCCVFDNEEVGSLTSQGADSTFLEDTLRRINSALGYDDANLLKAISKGYMISADNAHAVHPNHPEYADPTNKPVINGGIVIKYNANQKYTTDALSEAMFRDICKKAGVPVQTYVNRSNIAGGSTLGNLSNRHVSIKTIDIGLPQLAMHSAYETAGIKDTKYLIDAMIEYFG
ncbi:MAG: M18 family aminopeptidase [Lachnospiraceae bacterium]|nr:M18 family aminopeptidase [Candidatus Colinaster scatohippi]